VRTTLLAFAASVLLTAPLGAQERVGVDARLGVALPTGAFAEGLAPGARLSPGASFTAQVIVPRRLRSALLVGFAQHRLRCTGGACAGAGDLVSTSWNLGMRVRFTPSGTTPWLRLGLVLDRSEADVFAEGSLARQASYLGLGGEVGGGMSVVLRERVTLTPGVRYLALNTSFPSSGTVRMRYVVADLGVSLGF